GHQCQQRADRRERSRLQKVIDGCSRHWKSPPVLSPVLFPQFLQRLLSLFDVRQSQIRRLDDMSHEWLAPAAEEAQQVVDQSPLSCASRNGRLEDMGIADLLHPANCLLRLE